VQKISPPPWFDPRTVQPVTSRYTDWAISAHLICVIPLRNYRIQGGARYFSLLKSSGVHPVFCRTGSGSSPCATRSKRAGDHSTPSRAECVDHNSTPDAGLRGTDKDSFFLYYVPPAVTYGFTSSTNFGMNFDYSPHRTHQLVFTFGTQADYDAGIVSYYACYLFSKLSWSRFGIVVHFWKWTVLQMFRRNILAPFTVLKSLRRPEASKDYMLPRAQARSAAATRPGRNMSSSWFWY